MFGPDLCGYDVSHIHFIFNNKARHAAGGCLGRGTGGWASGRRVGRRAVARSDAAGER